MSNTVRHDLSPEEFEVLLTFESGKHYRRQEIKERFASFHTEPVVGAIYFYINLKVDTGDTTKHLLSLIKKGLVKTFHNEQQLYLKLSWLGELTIDPGN
jgi:hypothetical protein